MDIDAELEKIRKEMRRIQGIVAADERTDYMVNALEKLVHVVQEMRKAQRVGF